MQNLNKLYSILGYEFKDPNLIQLALTHRSAAALHNERLEFIGDGLVNLIIAEALYLSNPNAAEGELSRWRAGLVQRETLANIAKEWQLDLFLELGPGEKKTGGQHRPSTLANAVEAIFAAIYFDSDFINIKAFILKTYGQRLEHKEHLSKDAKTYLQEYLQAQHMPLAKYELIKTEGQDHDSIFYICCRLNDKQYAIGQGPNKRKAEQEAAKNLLKNLGLELK